VNSSNRQDLWRVSIPVNNYEIKNDSDGHQIIIDNVVFRLRGDEVVGTVDVNGTREDAIQKARQLIEQAINKLCYSLDTEVSLSTNASYTIDLTNKSSLERVSKEFTFKYNIRSNSNISSKQILSKLNCFEPAKISILLKALGSYKTALSIDNPFKAIETYFASIQAVIRENKKHLDTKELKEGIRSTLSKRIKEFDTLQFSKKFDRYYGKRSGSTHGRLDITNHEKKRLAISDVEEVKKWAREILDEFIDRNQTRRSNKHDL
jgi:hypothetical protein